MSFAEQGEYTRLTVAELLRFMKSVSGHDKPVHSMLQLFQLGDYHKVKIADLPSSKKIYLSLLRVYYAQQPIIVLEEPYFQLEEPDQLAFKRLLEELSEEKQILILTANLEDALISCDAIYRLDEAGLHLLDITDAEDEAENAHETGEAEFKIQKSRRKRTIKPFCSTRRKSIISKASIARLWFMWQGRPIRAHSPWRNWKTNSSITGFSAATARISLICKKCGN